MHATDLIDEVTRRTSGTGGDPLTRDDVKQVVESTLAAITDELCRGGTVQLTGFGSFKTSERNPTNPQTQEKMGPRRVPSFKPGQNLKDAVRGPQ